MSRYVLKVLQERTIYLSSSFHIPWCYQGDKLRAVCGMGIWAPLPLLTYLSPPKSSEPRWKGISLLGFNAYLNLNRFIIEIFSSIAPEFPTEFMIINDERWIVDEMRNDNQFWGMGREGGRKIWTPLSAPQFITNHQQHKFVDLHSFLIFYYFSQLIASGAQPVIRVRPTRAPRSSLFSLLWYLFSWSVFTIY